MNAKSTQNETARQSTKRHTYIHASDNTDDKPKGGRPEHGKSNDMLQCHPVDTQTGMYMEKQLRKFCQGHAINAFLSKKIVRPQTMLAFCKAEVDHDTALGRALKNPAYCPIEGNFPYMAVDAWLHHHCQPASRMVRIAINIPLGSQRQGFTAFLPQEINAFSLRLTPGCRLWRLPL